MAKFQDIFQQKLSSIRKKLKKEDPNASDTEEEEKSDQDKLTENDVLNAQKPEDDNSEDTDTDVDIPDEVSDEDKARMLKRKWIILGGGAAGLFIVSMMITNFMTGDVSNKQKDPPLRSTDIAAQGGAAKQDPSKGIPGKYSDIAKYSQKGNDANKKGADSKNSSIKPANKSGSSSSTSTYSDYPYTASSRSSNSSSSSTSSSRQKSRSGPSEIDQFEAEKRAERASYVASRGSSAADQAAIKAAQKRQQAEDKAIESAISFSLAANPSLNKGGAVSVSTSDNVSRSMTTSSYSILDGSEVGGTYALQAGSVIQATLITGITTDMANADVVAQVRQNIYDSQTGEHLLIPQGSRLIGKSGSAGSRGNARVGVVFTRLIYPDGHDVALPNQQAIDGVGYAGLKDQYTEHTGKLYSTAFVTALLSAAAQSATGNSSGSDDRSPGQEAVSGAVADVLDSMKTIIDRQGQVQPTATIRPGTEFSVFINQDLMLEEYSE